MRGRKPTPTALKILQGNPGRRPLNTTEPKPPVGMPDCPAFLSAEAQAEWGRFTKELLPLGLVTPLDRTALIVYCDDFSMLIEAGAMVRAKGLLIKTNNGNPIQNPYLAIANSTKERLLKVLEQFGGTPSARTRIHAAALPGDDAEEKDMFGDAR